MGLRIGYPPLTESAAIFEWWISYTYDNKGNIIRYESKAEDLINVQPSVYENNRSLDIVTSLRQK